MLSLNSVFVKTFFYNFNYYSFYSNSNVEREKLIKLIKSTPVEKLKGK